MSTTGTVASYFANGDIVKTVQVGDGQTQKIGVLASDVGEKLMQALKDVYVADGNGAGALAGQLNSTLVGTLQAAALPDSISAATSLNAATAANGDAYQSLKSTITSQESVSNLYQGFVSDIEDVDMAKALTNLSANQTALQAALSVTARLGQLSLLNYLPTSTSG